jgi:CDP-diacylglycerol---glycerol-3-phosphate 3-phosphatidyltransferase
MARTILQRLPNWLTFLRLFLIPLFVFLMHDPSPSMELASACVFVVAALTDVFDGMIARRFSAVSDLGKLLDPLADKILVMSALVMLVAQRSDISGRPWIPGWWVVLILAREIWVTGLRGVAASRGIVVAANDTGKVKSVFQMVAIVFLLLRGMEIRVFGFVFTGQAIGLNLLLISLFFAIWGAAEYTALVLSHSPEPDPAEHGP